MWNNMLILIYLKYVISLSSFFIPAHEDANIRWQDIDEGLYHVSEALLRDVDQQVFAGSMHKLLSRGLKPSQQVNYVPECS